MWYNVPRRTRTVVYLILSDYFKPMESRKDAKLRIERRERDKRISIHHIINKCSKDLFDNLQDKDNLKEWQW